MEHLGKTVSRLSGKTTERLTVSVPEAGRQLGIGRNAAYDAVRRGELPALRFGKKLVVSLAVLHRILGK